MQTIYVVSFTQLKTRKILVQQLHQVLFKSILKDIHSAVLDTYNWITPIMLLIIPQLNSIISAVKVVSFSDILWCDLLYISG